MTAQHRYANELIKTASIVLDCTPEQLINKGSQRRITIRRFMVMKYMFDCLRFRKEFIGDLFNRHPETVAAGIRTATDVLSVDVKYHYLYEELKKYLVCKKFTNKDDLDTITRFHWLSTQHIIAIKNLFSEYPIKKVFYDRYGFQHSELATMLLKKKYNAKLRDRMKLLLADADKLLQAN